MASAPFNPTKDPQCLQAMQTFVTGLAADPAKYMVSGPDVVTLTSAVDAFADALAICANPLTRTKVTIDLKNQAKFSSLGLCRQFANLIKYNAGINDADKLAIGVRPVNPNRTPSNCPQTQPIVSVLAASSGIQLLRFADVLTPESKAKPEGASELQLFCVVADQPVLDPNEAKFYGKFTKNPVTIEFPYADHGKRATYFARWAGIKGDVGPWSEAVSRAVAA